jgi:hypothetical protein
MIEFEPSNLFNVENVKKEILLVLDNYRKSPAMLAGASRPKRCYTTPSGDLYFKFGITNNEICAELFSYNIARQLDIEVAEVRLSQAGSVTGVSSHDIGDYTEVEDNDYSVCKYVHILGFVEMCLFDYLIMNEDRHGGNWGLIDEKVAPLFDHNYCFGGPDVVIDIDNFMALLTTPFYVFDYNNQMQDTLLKYFVKYHNDKVMKFIRKLSNLKEITVSLWMDYFPQECSHLNKILIARKNYMIKKVGEFSERYIDDNEL